MSFHFQAFTFLHFFIIYTLQLILEAESFGKVSTNWIHSTPSRHSNSVELLRRIPPPDPICPTFWPSNGGGNLPEKIQ
jgi:hypothetical protein